MKLSMFSRSALLVAPLLLSACQSTDMQIGASGIRTVPRDVSAAPADLLEGGTQRCASPLGTMVLAEGNAAAGLRNDMHLPPSSVLMRSIVERSNCFVLIERPFASGDGFSGSRGRVVSEYERGRLPSTAVRPNLPPQAPPADAADYELVSDFAFRNDGDRTGGLRGALGGLINGRLSSAWNGVNGSMQMREAQVQMTLVDRRTRALVAASDSRSTETDIAGLGGNLGGYTDSPQGKLISAAAVDAFNKLVTALRSKRSKAGLG